MADEDALRDGELAARISNTVVRPAVSDDRSSAREGKDHAPGERRVRGAAGHAHTRRAGASLTLARVRRCSICATGWQMRPKDVSREIGELMGR